MQPRNSEEMRLYAMGHLWDKTDGKASREAIMSFGFGAAWAFELMNAGNSDTVTGEVTEQQKKGLENGNI